MRLLITGADGFVGTHASRVLRERGDDVIELRGGHASATPTGRAIDMRNATAVRNALEWAQPEAILHLAGASSVARSHENPGEAFEVNALGTVHLLDAIRRTTPTARVVIVSSGEVYGPVPLGVRATELTPLNPTSPYASSKAAAEAATKQFHASYGLQAIITRPFSHLGRGQAGHFAVPSFARQIRAIQTSGRGELCVGNLAAVRDFSHVLDVVDAYRLLLERGVAGEIYNIASGEGRSMHSLLEELIALAGATLRPSIVPERMRPIELPVLVGDATKLRALGWKPTRTTTDGLRDALDEARAA